MFQCTFITCMGKGILPLRYNDIKKLRVKILLWMETVTHMSYWCSHFIDLVVKEHAHKTSESLILFYGEMSGKFGKPSGDSRRAFGHCRKTHREHSESLWVILGEYSDIVVKRILTTRGFRDVSRFWNSGGWQVCIFKENYGTSDQTRKSTTSFPGSTPLSRWRLREDEFGTGQRSELKLELASGRKTRWSCILALRDRAE